MPVFRRLSSLPHHYLVLGVHAAAILLCGTSPAAHAELSKGHRILIERGLQVQGMVANYDTFNLERYKQANYTAINWIWNSNVSLHGPAPGFPWSRWVHDPGQMPNAGEQPYLSQLVALQLGDEQHLNDAAIRNSVVNWFNDIRDQWPNTMLYVNNFGGQVNDAALADFITRARPDMLAFDTYPWRSTYVPPGPGQQSGTAGEPIGGQPTLWYSELRRYRAHAGANGLPLAIYRQTFRALQDYDQTVYRDPSPSELNLNTYGGLAFGATTFIDFTYNTGASTLFTPPGGDSNPTWAYHQQAEINQRARNLGKALVHLTGLRPAEWPTTDMLFLRGHTGPENTDRTPLPIGFEPHSSLPNTMSRWVADQNDPYMRGFAVANIGTKNDGRPGDVIISWFKPRDSSLDDPSHPADQIYFMVVNGLTGHDGTAADYRQRIHINFLGSVGTTIQRLNPDTGIVELVPLELIPNTGGRRRLVVELDGGMGELFKFNTGHPFVMTLPGDFNRDWVVDAADYVTWRKGLGARYTQDHYEEWRQNLGRTLAGGSGSGGQASLNVPEPTGWLLWGPVSAGLLLSRNVSRQFFVW